MRSVAYIILFGAFVLGAVWSCKKWKDSVAKPDPRLTNPYCNDPNAVNYNWGFPGKPDSTICFYPTDIFRGKYVFQDSIYSAATGLFIYTQRDTLYIFALSQTKMALHGLCTNGDTLRLTAGIGTTYMASVDTLVGDSATVSRGQIMCRQVDTVSGTLTRDLTDTSLFHVYLSVVTDTGIANHIGSAIKM
jgi:hypothetical protein